jgi:acetyl-CoA hydrolase
MTAEISDPATLDLARYIRLRPQAEPRRHRRARARLAAARRVSGRTRGGAADFLRGAARSEGGVPVLALPSTAGPSTASTVSRIVVRLNGPAGLSRADAGVIVTEYGVADLRGLSLARRRERMIAIAHPDHRAALDRTEDQI